MLNIFLPVGSSKSVWIVFFIYVNQLIPNFEFLIHSIICWYDGAYVCVAFSKVLSYKNIFEDCFKELPKRFLLHESEFINRNISLNAFHYLVESWEAWLNLSKYPSHTIHENRVSFPNWNRDLLICVRILYKGANPNLPVRALWFFHVRSHILVAESVGVCCWGFRLVFEKKTSWFSL